MTSSRRGLAIGLILALITAPAYAQRAPTPADPHVLALDVSAFPTGAVITHIHVDRTAAAVAKENVFGGTYSTTQGRLYQQWHFAGSLLESARLPPFHGAARQVWLLATIFPSRAGAVAAYTSDATFSRCSSTPVLPLPLRAATCTYLNPKGPEAGMYVVATAGAVEFDVVGFVEEASPAARERAVRDASYLAGHAAGHVNHLLALGSLGPPAATGLAWHSLPNPETGKLNHDLSDVSCPSATVCYAVGYSTLATTNGGASWQVQTGSPTHYLNGIACPSVTTCVSVGGAGTIVATTDGGTTWHAQQSGTAHNLYGVACPSSAACVAVGERGTILTTRDGGRTWTSRRNLDSGKVNHDFISVACPRVGVCYAVGYSTVATTDGGVSWQAQTGSPRFYLFGIACWRPRACLAAGERGTIVGTTDGGSTWTNRSSGIRMYLHRGFCTSAGACLVVGQNGTIWSTPNGGMSWRAQASGTTMTLWSVTCTPVGRCYAVGDKGTLLVRS